MPTSEVTQIPAHLTRGYVGVSEVVLRYLDVNSIDLFFWNERTGSLVLFRSADLQVTADVGAGLGELCGDMLYVRNNDYAQLCDEMLHSLDKIVAVESLAPTDRFQLVQTAISVELERTLRAIDPSAYLDLSERIGGQIRVLVSDHEVLPRDLYEIARHDSHTFSHVSNVASYSILLAEQLGISDRAELDEIATGAMLHDLGKRSIPNSILGKPGALTPDERAVIQTHPQRGYEELCQRDDVTFAQLMMVYQHHEQLNGSGYPVQILEEEIHPWARMLAVVDVFDALTGRRPYRRPLSIEEALQFLDDRRGTQFDSGW